MRISGLERLLGVVGYLPLLFWIPVKFKRDSMFVQFHGRQGGVLFVMWLITAFVLFLLLLFMRQSVIETILITVLFIATGIYLLFVLWAILKVALGERWRMPVVADVALMLGL